MRLIDADDLINGYKHMGYDPTEHPEESYMEGWCKGFNAAVEHCISHVIHAQTIDPQRTKGRWKLLPGRDDEHIRYLHCSVCHFNGDYESNFCPNCGADMRGDTDEV